MPVLANSKHEAVAQAYIADVERNGPRGYRSVYPKAGAKGAANGFSRLISDPAFAARVAELEAVLADKAAAAGLMAAKEVLAELSAIGRANMADYMTIGTDGDLRLHFHKLTRAQTAALAEVTVETYVEGRGDDAQKVKKVRFKLHDKHGALVDLGRHYGLFKERVEHTGKDCAALIPDDMSEFEIARRIAFILTEESARLEATNSASSG
jgi:phage terminase small subunit